MLKLLITFIYIVTAICDDTSKKRYDDYKVFQITPTTDSQLKFLRALSERNDDYQFWKEPSAKFQSAYLMVTPNKLQDFSQLMNVTRTNHQIHIENVQALIDQTKPSATLKSDTHFSWYYYNTYEEFNTWLDQLAAKYEQVEVVVAGKSYEGRPIKGVKVSWGKNNPGIFLEAGIHASEWLGPATVTYLLNELLTSEDAKVRRLAETHDWYIFPLLNPDGYAYAFEKDRLWRKSRVPTGNGCFGVDLNRNWDYQWMKQDSSDNPCDLRYAGTSPFSEPETKSISNYISSISSKLFAFISFHTFGQRLLLPYSYTKEHLDNYDELLAIGKKSINALARQYGIQYDIGNPPEVLYFASGGSMDWVKGVHKLPIVYTYQLRDTGYLGVLIRPDAIIPCGNEVLDSLVTMFEEASKLGFTNKTTQRTSP